MKRGCCCYGARATRRSISSGHGPALSSSPHYSSMVADWRATATSSFSLSFVASTLPFPHIDAKGLETTQ